MLKELSPHECRRLALEAIFELAAEDEDETGSVPEENQHLIQQWAKLAEDPAALNALLQKLHAEGNEGVRMSLDASGHEHKPKGPGGGQFDKKGGSATAAPKKSRVLKAAKALWRVANAVPQFARATIEKAGFSEKVGKATLLICTVGDSLVPGTHAFSALAIIIATIRKPSAPLSVVRDLIAKFRKSKAETRLSLPEGNHLLPVGKFLEGASDFEWAVTVLAVALEETGSLGEALEIAQQVIAEHPSAP